MQQLRELSVKGRQMENGEDLLQSVLLPERTDFVPQRRLKSMRGQGCQIPQGGELTGEQVLQVTTSHNT